jgi:hypothetical protein
LPCRTLQGVRPRAIRLPTAVMRAAQAVLATRPVAQRRAAEGDREWAAQQELVRQAVRQLRGAQAALLERLEAAPELAARRRRAVRRAAAGPVPREVPEWAGWEAFWASAETPEPQVSLVARRVSPEAWLEEVAPPEVRRGPGAWPALAGQVIPGGALVAAKRAR